MKVTVSQCDFLNVSYQTHPSNNGNNGDSYEFSIETTGRSCFVNGDQMEIFSFTIVGNEEIQEFFGAMELLARVYREIN